MKTKLSNSVHDAPWVDSTLFPHPHIEKYYRIKTRISDGLMLLELYDKDFKKAEEAYKKAKSDLDRATKSVIEANDAMLHFKDELRGIYRNGIDD